MKNATATSHGNSRLLEAGGVDETWAEFVEVTGFGVMAPENYSTSESENLLGCGTTPIVPSLPWTIFLLRFGVAPLEPSHPLAANEPRRPCLLLVT
jgi:hypothetical protein